MAEQLNFNHSYLTRPGNLYLFHLASPHVLPKSEILVEWGFASVQVQGGVLSEGHRSALDAIGEVLSMEVASSLGSADLGTSHMDPTHTSSYSQRGRGRGRGRGYSPAGKCQAQALPWTSCLGCCMK